MFAVGAALVAGTMLVTTHVVSQEQGEMNPDAMKEMWKKAAEPGPQHKEMARFAGHWKQNTKHWDMMTGSAEAEETVNWAEYKPILGGRYMVEHLSGTSKWDGEEKAFEAMGVFGYDNMRQKHFFLWFDSMSTGYMLGEGDEDENGNVVYYSDFEMGGGMTAKFKSVSRIVNDDRTEFEMYMQTPDGEWVKTLAIDSERARKKYKKDSP